MGFSLVAAHRLLIAVTSLVWSTGSRVCGLQHLGLNSWGSRGLAAPWHMGSSQTRDPTYVSCFGSWILYHWTTREALLWFLTHSYQCVLFGGFCFFFLLVCFFWRTSLLSSTARCCRFVSCVFPDPSLRSSRFSKSHSSD